MLILRSCFSALSQRQLDFSFNLIRQIEKISQLKTLEVLYFVQNKISKIEGLQTLVNLRSLELGANRIKVSLGKSRIFG